MALHIWSVACRKGVVDKFTSLVSLFDVIESLTLTVGAGSDFIAKTKEARKKGEYAGLPSEIMIVSLWHRSDPDIPEQATCRYRVLTPEGKVPPPDVEAIILDLETHVRVRTFGKVPSLPFAGFGDYWVLVETQVDDEKWKEVARLPIELKDGREEMGDQEAAHVED